MKERLKVIVMSLILAAVLAAPMGQVGRSAGIGSSVQGGQCYVGEHCGD